MHILKLVTIFNLDYIGLVSRKQEEGSLTQMTRSRPSLANKVQSADKFAAALSRADKVDKRRETRICIYNKL